MIILNIRIQAVLLIFFFLLTGCAVNSSEPPTMPPIGRTVGPQLSDNPDQAEKGSVIYWQVCMTCHGNLGQGLTLEWREQWGVDEMNCWQSKCHASNHPPQGFSFPQNCPAVVGPTALSRFQNALDLFENIYQNMPWWNPGSLSEEEAWQLTAYLMKYNGQLPNKVVLDESNASIFPLHAATSPPGSPRDELLVFAAILSFAAVAAALQNHLKQI